MCECTTRIRPQQKRFFFNAFHVSEKTKDARAELQFEQMLWGQRSAVDFLSFIRSFFLSSPHTYTHALSQLHCQ